MHTLEENINQASADFNRIKDKIVECGVDVPTDTSTSDYAAKVGAVYNKAYGEGKEAGKQAEYDSFWDSYQEYGAKRYYGGAFAGTGWTEKTFKPKYDMTNIYNTNNMFFDCGIKDDLTQILDNLGLTMSLDDNCSNATMMFAYSDFTRLPELNMVSCTTSTVFANTPNLETIDKIKVSETTTYNAWFNNCYALKNVIFEGVIAQNGLNFQSSHNLSRESITSIIYALSPITTGLSITLSKTAINNAFSGGGVWGVDSAAWTSLVNLRSNWTITLV